MKWIPAAVSALGAIVSVLCLLIAMWVRRR